jgi:Flp pilus assembly protein TadG
MSATILANFYRAVRSLWADTDGVILPYVTIMLVVFVGIGALALDGGRYMSLQTQLQKAADSYALAGAAELDRLTTSTARAYNAIQNRMAGQGTNDDLHGSNVTVQSIRFLSALPASDATPITAVLCSNNACTPAQSVLARFVEVTVTPKTLPAIMPIRFVNAAMGNLTAGASAVAGSDGVNCGLTPIFICNPFELAGDTYDQATARLEAADADVTGSFKRQLIRMGDAGGSGTWGPGDFGYLVPEPGTLPSDSCFPAGQEIGKAMAMDRPLVCVRQNGVDLLPGNTNSAKDGLNTRFGLYPAGGSLDNPACQSTYPPDENVRKGMKDKGGDWCKADPDGKDTGNGTNWPPGPNNGGLGVDSCLLGSSSCSPNENLGASTWNCTAYWNAAHPVGLGHAAPSGIVDPPGSSSRSCANSNVSRYEVYKWENSHNFNGDLGPNGETGTPQCVPANKKPNRRLMNVAIVNCRSSPVPIQSNAQNVPVAAFGQFFLTHAVTNQTKPYAEFVKIINRGDGGLYDQVQLYR